VADAEQKILLPSYYIPAQQDNYTLALKETKELGLKFYERTESGS